MIAIFQIRYSWALSTSRTSGKKLLTNVKCNIKKR